MGQYYYPTLIDEDKKLHVFYSHQYDNGLKLMEHSYVGNNFVNAVVSQIVDNPMKVAWIGDYSNDWGGDPYEEKLPRKEFMPLYRCVMARKKYEHPEPIRQDIESISGYLVNHTQKLVLDLKAYVVANKWREAWKDRLTGEIEEYDMCVHPLPLLTACGNGRGGGDYYDCHPDYDKVGTWAFDRIQLITEKPDGYAEVTYHFTEREGAD